MDPRTSSVSSGSASLNVSTWGTGGRPILALHPGVGDSRIWARCAPIWTEADYQVIAHDRRGFGKTRYTAEPHDDLADLLLVSAAADARPAIVVGNSRGGGLALDLALAHPDHVSALVLIAPSPSGYDYDSWPTAVAESEQDDLIAAADAAGDIDLVNRLETRYWLDGVDQREGRVQGDARDLFLEMNGVALRAAPIGDSASRPVAWPLLSQITVPTLVVVGDLDLPGVGVQGAEIARSVAAGQLVTIAGAAHCPQLDQPELLSRAVIDFLASSTV